VCACVCVCVYVYMCVCMCVCVCIVAYEWADANSVRVRVSLYTLTTIQPRSHLFSLSENTYNIIAPHTAGILCDTFRTTSERGTLCSGQTESHVSTQDMKSPSFVY